MADKYTFVLTDENVVDADGERFIVKGIDLSRMQSNGVCLFVHGRRWSTKVKYIVIGTWSNFRIREGQLLADVEFDQSDPEAKAIEEKVKGGFLKAASPRYRPISVSDDLGDKLPGQVGLTYVKSLMIEASIVDIPANENALRVKSIDDDSPLIKTITKSFHQPENPEPDPKLPTPKPDMDPESNIEKTMDAEVNKALGLPEEVSSAKTLAAVNKLKEEKEAAEKSLRDRTENEARDLAALAVKKELIKADQQESTTKWFANDLNMARTFVGQDTTEKSTDDQKGGKRLPDKNQGKLEKFLGKVTDKGESGDKTIKKYSELSDEEIEKLEDDEREKLMKAEGII